MGLVRTTPAGRTRLLALVETAEEASLGVAAGALAVCLDGAAWRAAEPDTLRALKRSAFLVLRGAAPFGAVDPDAVLIDASAPRCEEMEAILVLQPDARTDLPASGIGSVMLDSGMDRLLDVLSFAELADFADACRDAGLSFSFSGALEAPDVPRLLPLKPAFLCFREALRTPAGGFDEEACRDLSGLFVPPVRADTPHATPDRVFVRDLVEDMEIGAYGAERGRRQRVRFSMEAELAPGAGAPTLSGIYSYDRMIDAARALAARGHEALVETLAEDLAREILLDARVLAVTVRVEKLDLGPGSAGVEIRRERA